MHKPTDMASPKPVSARKRLTDMLNRQSVAEARQRKFIILAVMVMALSGCAARQVRPSSATFARAVGSTASNTQQAFEIVQTRYAEAQARSLVVNYDQSGFHPAEIRDWLDPADIEVRFRLLELLRDYASMLASISASDALGQSDPLPLQPLHALGDLSQSQAFQILATKTSVNASAAALAVHAIGNVLIERRRRRELPRLIQQMQQPVRTICELLGQDLGQRPDAANAGGHGLRDELWRKYSSLIQDQSVFIDQNKGKIDPVRRAVEIEKLPQLVRAQRELDQLLAQTQSALQSIAAAHEELLHVAEAQQNLGVKIAALAAESQHISELYGRLSK